MRQGYSLTVAARARERLLVGSTSFLQFTADAKWIRGIGENSRFIARGSFGATEVGDFDKLPPELRFFAGGDRSIRGYAYQTIGPPLPDELVPDALARCAADRNQECQTLMIGGKFLPSSAPNTSTTSSRTGASRRSSTPAMRSRIQRLPAESRRRFRRALALAGRHGPRRSRFPRARQTEFTVSSCIS